MTKVNKILVLIFTLVLLTAAPVYAANNSTPTKIDESKIDTDELKSIEKLIVCQDECGMILADCDNQTALYMRNIVKQQMSQGKSKQEILDYFVGIYGEKVLASPTKTGFNITVWVVPFIALLGGGILVYLALDKWVFINKMDNIDAEDIKKKIVPELEKYEDKLDDELKKYL